jgi:hypothetical protein
MRVENGQAYYYIDDKMLIQTGVELGTPLNDVHYHVENYFSSYYHAFMMLESIRKNIKYYEGVSITTHLKAILYHIKYILKILKSWFI